MSPGFKSLDNTSDRKIRTFVLRQGRLTQGQDNALKEHWPVYGLDSDTGVLDVESVFGNSNPVIFEIGFGMGDSLVAQACQHPDINYLGTEVHRPGVGHLLIGLVEAGLTNLRVFAEDGLDVLTHCIPDASLAGLQLFFPDPWHKKRHHKRRIMNPEFLSLASRKLASGGFLHMATDWVPYAEEAEALMAADERFEMTTPPDRPETKFERRGLQLGHEVRDLAVRLI